MGERKGVNKYYPPDYDPKKGGLNKFMGTHALRERARKLHLGIIIIRFEMPYNIWCEGCNNHIGMGVRYNAEKSKIGMYYSTPVYQFRMKCHLCDNHFEIKTDPANLDYVIISGARRQERRWDPTENGQVVPDDKQVIHKLADDAMFKLQHGVVDHKKLKDVTPALSKLENLQERWKDDYMANKALRDIFRTRKRELQEQQSKDKEFLKKRSLDIPLLQESSDDAKVASLIRLQPSLSVEERQQEKRSEIDKKSRFPFPLLTASEGSSLSVTDGHEADSGLEVDQQPSKILDTHSCLQQRRLSFGIKLKSVQPASSAAKKKVEPEEIKTSNVNDSTVSHVADTQTSKNKEFPNNVIDKAGINPNNEGGHHDANNKCLQDTDTNMKIKNVNLVTSTQVSSSNKRLVSALVSYSDDSEQNSSGSGSENEEAN